MSAHRYLVELRVDDVNSAVGLDLPVVSELPGALQRAIAQILAGRLADRGVVVEGITVTTQE